MRVLVAELKQETATFNPMVSRYDIIERKEIFMGSVGGQLGWHNLAHQTMQSSLAERKPMV